MRVLLMAALLATAACDRSQQAEAPSVAEAQAFLAQNRTQPGVVTTKSGLQYKVVRAGPKDRPTARDGDEVKVHYEGKLVSGQVFDSSYEQGAPSVFTVGQLVDGWNEALQLMRPGDEFLLWVPPELGYGEEGVGPIPPNSVLVFRMEMLDVLPKGGGVGLG